MYGSQVGGTLAAALLGVSSAAVVPTSNQTHVAAAQITRQLATTGTSMTVTLAVIAALLLLTGALLMSLSRRHSHRLV